jgi:NADH dehydrogenase FAD-containing subunit
MAAALGGTLVIGGGFAGGYVARLLGKRGATIVSPENFMLYTPLLPEAASGTLEPRHVIVPLRMMCPHAELLLGPATELDLLGRRAHVETEEGIVTVGLENVVVALGAISRTLPIPGLADHALGFKTLADAIYLRNRERKPYRYRMLGQVAMLGRYKGIAQIPGALPRGFPGWFVTRTYHLYQLPLLTRKLRVVTDWTVALFFRRDIAELGMLGHPESLRDEQ